MPRKFERHIEHWRDRDGRMRYYFRKGKGPRIPLPDNPDSEELDTAYQAALAGLVMAKRERREPDKPDTIAALVGSYLRSAAYVGLRDTSKKGYASRIEMLRTEHGHRTVSGLTRERIITGILQPYANRPGAALSTLKMLRILVRHAIDI